MRKLAFVIEPASSATNTRFVLTAKAGRSFTAETVRTKLFVVVSVPSSAIKVIVAVPLAFVSGVNVIVKAELVAPTLFVAVSATVTRFVSEEATVTETLVFAVSVSITLTTAVLFVVASSRIVLEVTPREIGCVVRRSDADAERVRDGIHTTARYAVAVFHHNRDEVRAHRIRRGAEGQRTVRADRRRGRIAEVRTDVTVNVQVCADSLVGPVLMPVKSWRS